MKEELVLLVCMYIMVMSYSNLKKNIQEILLDLTTLIIVPIGFTIKLIKIINKKFKER